MTEGSQHNPHLSLAAIHEYLFRVHDYFTVHEDLEVGADAGHRRLLRNRATLTRFILVAFSCNGLGGEVV